MYKSPPSACAIPAAISPWSMESIGLEIDSHNLGGPATGTGTVLNLVSYVPFVIARTFVAAKVGWVNGAVTGNSNAQVGIYNEDGTQIVECTATTTVNINARQTIDITDTTLAGPGRYYMAFRAANITDRFFQIAPTIGTLEAMGVLQQTGQADLPSPATFAIPTSAWLPLFYIQGHTIA